MLARKTLPDLIQLEADRGGKTPSAAPRIALETSDHAIAEAARAVASDYQSVEVRYLSVQTGPRRRPGAAALSTTRSGDTQQAPARRVVLGIPPEGDSLAEIIKRGVWAVVDPSHPGFAGRLKNVIDELIAGKCPSLGRLADDPAAASSLMSSLALAPERRGSGAANPLTQSEAEILSRIASGQTSRRIAEELGFHLQTVKNRVTNILNKTNANSRSHAAAIAQANGWIKPGASRG
jgi:DNA-binding NarL/FixJ family response regulator